MPAAEMGTASQQLGMQVGIKCGPRIASVVHLHPKAYGSLREPSSMLCVMMSPLPQFFLIR